MSTYISNVTSHQSLTSFKTFYTHGHIKNMNKQYIEVT